MCRSQIEGKYGDSIFSYSHILIFSPAVHQTGHPILSAQSTFNETTYSLQIILQNWVNLGHVENISKSYKEKQIVLTFYNTIIHTALSASGLTLGEMDFASRVLRSQSVLDKLSEFKELCSGGGNFAESFLTMCRRDLVGKSFLARYGGIKTYIIDDIELQKTPLNHVFTWRGKQTTLLEYYQQQYSITRAASDIEL